MSHFSHVANNAISGVLGNLELMEDDSGDFLWEDRRSQFTSAIRTLRKYFGLIEKFPDFARDEATKMGGHFPKIAEEVVTGYIYVDRAYDNLIKRL